MNIPTTTYARCGFLLAYFVDSNQQPKSRIKSIFLHVLRVPTYSIDTRKKKCKFRVAIRIRANDDIGTTRRDATVLCVRISVMDAVKMCEFDRLTFYNIEYYQARV